MAKTRKRQRGGIRNPFRKKKKELGDKYRYIPSQKKDPSAIDIVCPQCKGVKFVQKKSMLRGGRIASYFGAEWIFDKNAWIYICINCSQITWFKRKLTKIKA